MGISVNEAGKRGGSTVLRKYGRQFYAAIGKKGATATHERYPGKASMWGKLGGRPRKPKLEEITGEEQRIARKEARTRLGTAAPPLSDSDSVIKPPCDK